MTPGIMFTTASIILVLMTLIKVCEGSMISWPEGQYSLLKPTTGCPVGWPQKSGWIYQDTEDTQPSNNRSEVLHMQGYVGPSYVLRSFCVKTDNQGTSWPKGQYCVYNKYFSNCPKTSGMSTGQIRWDDENTNNQTKYVQPLPYVDTYKGNLRLSFCCANNGNRSVPIKLPASRPFYLLPYNSSKCQQVEWMVATMEWIKYDKENTGTDYSERTGSVPYNTLNKEKDITMYYCYYKSCNYTLESLTGSFQSPGYPNNYTDGQLCSWKITVPSNYTVKITFTTFDLYNDNDTLEHYVQLNESYSLIYRYRGDDVPEVVTSHSNDVMFVFRSNEKYNSNGFRAEYDIFPTEELYTTAATTTETNRPTTRPETTEHVVMTTVESLKPNKTSTHAPAKASACQEGSTVILIVIPLVCFIVVVVVIIDIWYRCRHRAGKLQVDNINLSPDMAVNGIYDCEMIVSQCSTITRPAADGTDVKELNHFESNGDQEIYQNADYFPESPSHQSLNKPRGPSVHSDFYLEPLQCMPEGDPEPGQYTEAAERGPMVDSEEYGNIEHDPMVDSEVYGNIESPREVPRVVSGEYGYLEPLGYVPRNDSDETPMENRSDNDQSKLLSDVSGDDVNEVSNDVTMSGDNPIYVYDNVCDTLNEDLYDSVD